MKSRLIDYVQGYVRVNVSGSSFEPLINRLVGAGIAVWNIRRTGGRMGELMISLPGFFRLKPYLKETGCRIHVTERHGFPFLLHKLGRRKWFVAGMAMCLVGMYMLSSLVWTIEVTGNETISADRVLQAAAKEGLYPFQWKYRLAEPGVLSDNLVRSIPDVAWVGVEMSGTKVTIRVVESTLPETKEPLSPRHLVSSSDAVISSIIAERGVPQVRVHSRVKQGDILISGILGDEENRKVVVAEGSVRGLVWYEYKVRSPLVRRQAVLTGDKRTSFHLVIGNRALQLTGYRQTSYEQEKIESNRRQWTIGRWTLPVGWIERTHLETHTAEQRLTREEAVEAAIVHAKAEAMATLGGRPVIRDEKILHERIDSGKVEVHVLFEVELDIAVEQPIVEPPPSSPPT